LLPKTPKPLISDLNIGNLLLCNILSYRSFIELSFCRQ